MSGIWTSKKLPGKKKYSSNFFTALKQRVSHIQRKSTWQPVKKSGGQTLYKSYSSKNAKSSGY